MSLAAPAATLRRRHRATGRAAAAASRPAPRRLELWAASIAVFLGPINFARFPAIYFTFSDAIVLACLGLAVMTRQLPLRPFGAGTPIYLLGLVLMTFGLMASSIVNGDPARGMIVFAQYYVAWFLLPLFLLNRPADDIAVLVKAFVLSIAVMVLHGIYLIHIDGQRDTVFVSGNGRLRGFVERTNECAALMGLTLPLVLWLWRTRRLSMLLSIAAFGLVTYGILLTGSNTGAITALAGMMLFLVTTMPLDRLVIAGALAATIAGVGVTAGREYLPSVFRDRVLSAVDSGSLDDAGTFAGRMLLTREAIEFTRRTWVFGFGADGYQANSRFDAPVHDVYLLIWTEGGFIALCGWLTMLLALATSVMLAGARRVDAMLGISTLLPFMLLVSGTPHVYGRFWVFPVILALGVATRGRAMTPPRRRRG